MSMPKAEEDEGPVLTRRQADGFRARKSRTVPRIYDREAIKEFLSGKIDREEMLRRIRQ